MSDRFRQRYGPWALVAGASEGLGAAFARELAARGLNVLLLARRQEPLEAEAAAIARDHRVEARAVVCDLAAQDLPTRLAAIVDGLDVGLAVYNAAYAPIQPFYELSLEDKLRIVDVNCRGPVVLADVLGRPMVARGRGGLVIMASLAGFQGAPLITTYAASKAFDRVLAEGLWAELRHAGVDVLASCAGATGTPGYARSQPDGGGTPMDPADVVRDALGALGRRPSTIPGLGNRAATFLLTRLLTRRRAVSLMDSAMRRLYGGGRAPDPLEDRSQT